MTDTSKTVFISYRRSVTRYLALSMFKDLRKRGYDVFWDIEGIGSGQFEKIILTQIEAREHFIVLLAHGSLDRCKNHGDWLRREIEYAIEKERNVIPVLVDGFTFSDGKEFLTHDLSTLETYNAIDLYISYFDAAMERLCNQYLTERASGLVVPAPLDTEDVVEEIVRDAEKEPTPTADKLTAEQWFFRAVEKQNRRDFDKAIADYNEAIRLSPEFAEAYYNRGVAYRYKPDLEAAFADFDEAIRLNPRLAEAYNNRGLVHANKGDLDAAIADFVQSIELDNPELHLPYFNRGLVHANKGDLDAAIADYNEVIRLNPEYKYAFNNRGVAHEHKGDLDAAIADYNEAIRLDPKSALSYSNRGEVHFQNGDYLEALADFQKAHTLESNLNYALAGLAITHHVQGKISEAERLWRVLVGMDERYLDAEWVQEELNYQEVLVEEARKVIARLG